MNNEKNILAIRIKELRTDLELTQEELALKLGLKGKSSIANYEKGTITPSDEVKLRMCEIFDCSLDYLMGKTDIQNLEDEISSVDEDAITKTLIAQNYNTIKSFELTYEEIEILTKLLTLTTKKEYDQTMVSCKKILSRFEDSKQNKIMDFFSELFYKKIKMLYNEKHSLFYSCPVYGKISAGLPNWAEECLEGYLPVDPNLMGIINPEECFFLRVDGESMNKVIRNGAYALIRKQDIVENGEIAAVLVNGFDATLKKFSKQGDLVILEPMSEDSSFTTQVYNKDTQINILGKYIGKFEMN